MGASLIMKYTSQGNNNLLTYSNDTKKITLNSHTVRAEKRGLYGVGHRKTSDTDPWIRALSQCSH